MAWQTSNQRNNHTRGKAGPPTCEVKHAHVHTRRPTAGVPGHERATNKPQPSKPSDQQQEENNLTFASTYDPRCTAASGPDRQGHFGPGLCGPTQTARAADREDERAYPSRQGCEGIPNRYACTTQAPDTTSTCRSGRGGAHGTTPGTQWPQEPHSDSQEQPSWHGCASSHG
jgi:hypothetical protein